MRIAVVTGASSGMGRKFVEVFDGEGLDEIWGIGLNKEKLEEVKASTKTAFRFFDMDLTDEKNLLVYEDALKQANPDVAYLINASGYGKFGRYDEINKETCMNMIDLNCKALVFLTQTTLPYMQKGARIGQFSSVASFQPVPYINVYAATKAFVLSYSRALNEELRPRGITVTAICPFWTRTAFFDRAKKVEHKTIDEVVTKYAVMYDPEKVIKKAFKDVKNGKGVSIYGFKAKEQMILSKFMPKTLLMRGWIKQQHLDEKYEGK